METGAINLFRPSAHSVPVSGTVPGAAAGPSDQVIRKAAAMVDKEEPGAAEPEVMAKAQALEALIEKGARLLGAGRS
jgi:hypothetical protein